MELEKKLMKGVLRIKIKRIRVNENIYANDIRLIDSNKNQEQFLSLLRERDIHAYIGYMPLHSSPMGKRFGYKANDLPITEDLASRIVRLPFYTTLQGELLDYCIDGLQSVLRIIYDY